MKKILVIGGAGYIGSHMVQMLQDTGYQPIVLDNLSTGYADAVKTAPLVIGSLGDEAVLDGLFRDHDFQAVMHFAAFSQVGESMRDPAAYYANNTASTLTLLQAMHRHGVKRFIFSSTAAVYGHPQTQLIDESTPTAPINPYGRSKLMVEQMLADFAGAYGLRYVALRYFNAAGADPEGRYGERHEPETHLIPLVLQVASGRRENISIFGDDYDTPDGSCIRDYVHVVDLCRAHEQALRWLLADRESAVFNLGNGLGFSVQEVIETARIVTGHAIPSRLAERRAGDPARLVADSRKARSELGWAPRHGELESMIRHAWAWELGQFERKAAQAFARAQQPAARLSLRLQMAT